MDLDTWVSIGALIGTGLALAAFMYKSLNSLERRLSTRINETNTALEALRGTVEENRREAHAAAEAIRREAREQAEAHSSRLHDLYELLLRSQLGHSRKA